LRLEKANYRERKASGLRKEGEEVRLPKEMVWSYIYLKNQQRWSHGRQGRNFKGSMINREDIKTSLQCSVCNW